jgi:MinD superfamily P-loop ATPase
MYSGSFRNGKMVYGRLSPGEENSGRLVDIVREKAKLVSKEAGYPTIIIDGPPGIGCPVISTITGVDHAVIVTEPTVSGLHDLKRTLEVVSKFRLKVSVIINKSDLNTNMAEEIETYCKTQNTKIIVHLPFDRSIVDAMVNCKSIIEWAPESEIAGLLKNTYERILNSN